MYNKFLQCNKIADTAEGDQALIFNNAIQRYKIAELLKEAKY